MAGLAVAYVLASSWFGLTGPHMTDANFGDAGDFFVSVWSDTLAADVVFVVGTLAAGALLLVVARRLRDRPAGWLGAAGVGFLAHWAVYWASYLLLDATANQNVDGAMEAAEFVLEWGAGGLLLAAAIPVALVWSERFELPEGWPGRRPRVETRSGQR